MSATTWQSGMRMTAARLNAAPRGVVGSNKSTAATTAITTTETKDGGVGDVVFTAESGRRYRVTYSCRGEATVAAVTGDVRIRTGVGASPTNASQQLTGAACPLTGFAGSDYRQLEVTETIKCPTDIAAGQHNLAAFYVRTAGTGNFRLGNASGQSRELTVEDLGVEP